MQPQGHRSIRVTCATCTVAGFAQRGRALRAAGRDAGRLTVSCGDAGEEVLLFAEEEVAALGPVASRAAVEVGGGGRDGE